MEKYNKLHLLLWVLLSAITLFITLIVLLDPLTEIYDNMSIWFFFLFFCSEVIGVILSTLIIDHIPNTAIFNLHTKPFTINHGSILGWFFATLRTVKF
ncbi:MAG TPA: hypothetical protein VMT42_06495 [candidate division Zixibacteria bacterium]|nr:hypothetical protein [candidate division Zixibacteria bacterium]